MIFIAAFLAGSFAYLGFAPNSIWIAPIISLFILNRVLDGKRLIKRFGLSQVFGLGLLLPTQIWTGTYVGNAPWLLLAVIQSFLFWPFAIRFKTKRSTNAFLFAFSAVLTELLLRTIPFTGFGWSRLSFTQSNGPLAVIYPYLGCAGVIFAMAYLGSVKRIFPLSLVLLIILSLNFIPAPNKSGSSFRIALVQGGVKDLGLNFNATPREVFNSHLATTIKTVKPNAVDLIIWPENSVDVDLYQYADVRNAIGELSKSLNTPILIGGITRNNGQLRNISAYFDPDISSVYTKRYLTPFGEYIPLRSFLQKFTDLTDQVDDFKAGSQNNTVAIKEKTAQIFICYELLNDSFVRQVDSDFLIVQTNNATFGDTQQLDQELQIAKVRALETGREVAYVSTTGITSFINSDGSMKSQIPKFQSAVLIDTVQMHRNQNLSQKLSIYPELFSIFMILFLLIRNRRFA
jgi:apolipoprotein N-acyltransferase